MPGIDSVAADQFKLPLGDMLNQSGDKLKSRV